MSMLDSFFTKGFKAAKCKTLLKLTIPRIKLLRNRREVQIKQMRRDIAKLLETGQEATARIRVEHIIREEKMMAAQEIVELFCELISVRLPIIEAQRECPLDLKEAISSVCFAAPRCADLPELLQVQMLFAAKYGKEFVSAATELMPECGVNRQLIELLSVRAPDPGVKLNLLKEIAEEHELDWDPAASETELLKPHEDLLNGPTQFVSGSKLPLPKEKHDESLYSASEQAPSEQSDPDFGLDTLDFPEVPKVPVQPSVGNVRTPEMLPFPEVNLGSAVDSDANGSSSYKPHLEPAETFAEKSVSDGAESPKIPLGSTENKQFLPFISPPSTSSATFSMGPSQPTVPPSRTKSDVVIDLQDVLAAAQAAADTAERAAAAARSAASLAHLRISELVKKKSEEIPEDSVENPFHSDTYHSVGMNKPEPVLSHSSSLTDTMDISNPSTPHQHLENPPVKQVSSPLLYDDPKVEYAREGPHLDPVHHPPQRLTSMDDESYLSYPNLFGRQDSIPGSGVHSFADHSPSPH